MKIGTKSVLYGVHQFAVHPWFVAWAWLKLHGFQRVLIGTGPQFTSILDPRLWLAFFLHDIGYIGKPNMDGPEGELHPELGARIMGRLFGAHWYAFVKYHSRFLAKQDGQKPSVLCIADKLAITLPPRWLYLRLARATGEIREYMAKSDRNNETGGKYASAHLTLTDEESWHRDMCDYVRRWVEAHKDGREDTWTPAPTKVA
jgi:hypothetical protein